jgi:alkanesulfonate monooxygenase SsuD/methylene tetrahydromethanopterin reductase-like flavin-dependent oxidoreductase (luciferase family)
MMLRRWVRGVPPIAGGAGSVHPRRLCHARLVEIDLLFDPFGVRVDDALAGATAAERAGFGGVWLYDHLVSVVDR